MRVISGKYKGLKLVSNNKIDSKRQEFVTRPTSDRVKETIFNMLQNSFHLRLDSMSFLDIFSGSGAIGIEAISRGSELVYFIDNDYEACRLIKYNLAKLSQGEGLGSVEANVLKKNFLDENLLLEKKFDIIFLDPPYDKFTSENVFQRLLEMDVIKKDTLIVFESDSNQAGIGGFNLIDIRNIGKTFISFFKVSY